MREGAGAVERDLHPVLRPRRVGRLALPRRRRRRLLQADRQQIAQCIYGVARDFANNDAGGTRAADFCNLQSAGTLRGFCFYAVGTILGTLGHPDSWIKSTCATLAGRYAPECTGKVDAAEFKLINNGTPGS